MDYSPPPHTSLDILYKDEFLLVINKPSGLLSVPGRGQDKQDCLISRVQAEYSDALIVHRLDMSTSGLMIIARGKEMESYLSILFQQREVKKKYIAIVSGKVAPEQGEINLPLMTDWPNRPKQKVDFESGKPSQTKYLVLSDNDNNSRVELTPVTGRTHQLRVHTAHQDGLNNPIVGDQLYGQDAERLMLHAQRLAFTHPRTGKRMILETDSPF